MPSEPPQPQPTPPQAAQNNAGQQAQPSPQQQQPPAPQPQNNNQTAQLQAPPVPQPRKSPPVNFNNGGYVGSQISQAANAAAASRGATGSDGGDFGTNLGNGASAQGNLEVLSDTMGVDFGPYLSRVVQNVRQNWYNLIPEVARPPIMAGPPPNKSPEQVHHRHRAYAMETTGLLIIAVVLLVLTLIRYWSAVHQLFR